MMDDSIAEMRSVLRMFGVKGVDKFTDKETSVLWEAGYRDVDLLNDANPDTLLRSKVAAALVDAIVASQRRRRGVAAGPGPGSAAAAGSARPPGRIVPRGRGLSALPASPRTTVPTFVARPHRGRTRPGAAARKGCPEATRMMQALHSMQAVPGPDEVLKLGNNDPFLFHPEYDSLFVRECYPRLFDALVRHSKPCKYIVTGTPGIGKSCFLYYLLARLLKNTAPPPFIVWEHYSEPGKVWCYTHETRAVVTGVRASFDGVLANPATWYITDAVPPKFMSRARIVLLTSPKRETYKELRKLQAKMLCMPFWELDELLACRSLVYGAVGEALAKELYQHYGGVARFVLEAPGSQPDEGLDKLLEELREAVAGCNIAQMRSSIGSISTGPEASHRLLHIVADINFNVQQLVFASQWVAEEFAKQASKAELQELISLLSSSTGTLQGMLYEAVMHAVLPKGGPYTVAPVDNKTMGRGVEEKLELDRCTETELFKDLPENATEQVYYRPSSSNFPTVDAFRRGKDTCDFFQMTVGSSKELDAKQLGSMLTQLKLPNDATPRLHFVVPEEKYANFKLTAGKNWPPTKKQAAYRMKLYIMKGVYARLQVCARSVHAGCPMAGGGRRLWL